MHGGVRKTLLYSRIPCIQGDMTGSYRRGAGCDREPESSCDRYTAIAREDAGKVVLSDQADRPWA